MKLSRELQCAACGKPVRRDVAVKVDVWDTEDVETVVCSPECADAYAGGVASRPPAPGLLREHKIAAAVLGLAAAGDIIRAVAARWLADPLGTLTPWPVQLANAVIWVVLAVGVIRGRPMARMAALIVAGVVAVAHLAAATGSADFRVLLVPASVTLPLALVLIGRPGTVRLSLAAAAALLLPIFMGWQTVLLLSERRAALARIEAVALPGRSVTSGPEGIRMDLPSGWQALQRENGLVDWPHSEIEMIHTASGAVGFVVLNPDCDQRAIPEFQERSLAALVQTGRELVVIGLTRIDVGAMEIRVQNRRGGRRVESYELFRELDTPAHGDRAHPELPGCIWLHCLAPPRAEDRVRQDCRQMVATVRRDPLP